MFALGVADAAQFAAGALAHLSHHSLYNQELIGREPGIMHRISVLLGDRNSGTLHYCVLALANLGCAAVNQEKMAATPGLVAQARHVPSLCVGGYLIMCFAVFEACGKR